MTIRSEGAGRPAWPSALAGIKVGTAMAAAAEVMKRRREIREVVASILEAKMANQTPGRERKI
jgi:ABC-type uncharacterized transport system permease subunit